jgi:hypothetical protein
MQDVAGVLLTEPFCPFLLTEPFLQSFQAFDNLFQRAHKVESNISIRDKTEQSVKGISNIVQDGRPKTQVYPPAEVSRIMP